MKITRNINGQQIEIELNANELMQAKREYDKKRLGLAIVDELAYVYSEYKPLTKEQIEELAEKWVDKVVDNEFIENAYYGMFREIEKLIGFDPELED